MNLSRCFSAYDRLHNNSGVCAIPRVGRTNDMYDILIIFVSGHINSSYAACYCRKSGDNIIIFRFLKRLVAARGCYDSCWETKYGVVYWCRGFDSIRKGAAISYAGGDTRSCGSRLLLYSEGGKQGCGLVANVIIVHLARLWSFAASIGGGDEDGVTERLAMS